MKITRYPRSVALLLLRAYKYAISPMFPPSCRYTPTCSEYAVEAIDRYGVVRGSAMSVWRLLRCHPFVRGGYDPVQIESHVGTGALTRGPHLTRFSAGGVVNRPAEQSSARS